MKKVVYFIWAFIAGIFTQFYAKIVYGENVFQTAYGVQIYTTFNNVRVLVYLIGLISIVWLFISSIITVCRGEKNPTDISKKWGKFIKNKKKVKITFMDNGQKITKLCRIISADKKKVIFEDKENQYECSPKEILKIQKRNKSLIGLIIVISCFVVLAIVDFIISIGIRDSMDGVATFYGVEIEDYDDLELR